jgi:quercetin dioxygenase-like cupin family protein
VPSNDSVGARMLHSAYMSGAYVLRPGESERRWFFETYTDFLADGERTGGAFALVDERAKRGESVPLHRHDDDWESFFVVEGELTIFIGDEGVRAPAGSFAHIPGGTVHGFRVESETARYLILTTPRHGEFYRAISLPAQGDGTPPAEPIQGSQIGEAAREYGIERVGPLPD